jgi:hypothetical protein
LVFFLLLIDPRKVIAKGCMEHNFFGCEGCPFSLTKQFPYSTFPKDCCFCDWDLCNDGRLGASKTGPIPPVDLGEGNISWSRFLLYTSMTGGFFVFLGVSAFYKCLMCADECQKPCLGAEQLIGKRYEEEEEGGEGDGFEELEN